MPVRAVVFDLFDTLVDLPMDTLPRVAIGGREIPSTMGALHDALRTRAEVDFGDFARVMTAVDREWRASYWEHHREFPTDERFERVAKALGLADPGIPALLTEVHMGMLRAIAVTPPHHAALLARLHERFAIGLCSNFSWSPAALAILEEARLSGSIDAALISHTHGLRKPRADIFEAVLAALGVEPADALHVGDNLVADVSGANAIGMRTAWITRCVRDPAAALARYDGPPPDHTIADLAELEVLLA